MSLPICMISCNDSASENSRLDHASKAHSNQLERRFANSQNFFESREHPGSPVNAQIHGTPGYSRGFTLGLTFHLFNKGN